MALTIHTGDLNEKLTFRKPTVTTNDEGGRDISYAADTLTIWGMVKSINQTRVLEGSGDALVDAKEVYVRNANNRAEISKDWLLVHKGVVHIIQSKEPFDDNRFLKFIAKSKGTGAETPTVPGGGDDGSVIGTPDPTGPVLTVTVIGFGEFFVSVGQPATVDFGDGTPLKLMKFGSHQYALPEATEIKIYHHNLSDTLILQSNTVYVEDITGDTPPLIDYLTIIARLPVMPPLTPLIKYAALQANRLTPEIMDNIIDTLVTNGVENGHLDLRFNDGLPTNTDGINTLVSRGWEVSYGDEI